MKKTEIKHCCRSSREITVISVLFHVVRAALKNNDKDEYPPYLSEDDVACCFMLEGRLSVMF